MYWLKMAVSASQWASEKEVFENVFIQEMEVTWAALTCSVNEDQSSNADKTKGTYLQTPKMWGVFIDVILKDFYFNPDMGSIKIVNTNLTKKTSITAQWKTDVHIHLHTHTCHVPVCLDVCIYISSLPFIQDNVFSCCCELWAITVESTYRSRKRLLTLKWGKLRQFVSISASAWRFPFQISSFKMLGSRSLIV